LREGDVWVRFVRGDSVGIGVGGVRRGRRGKEVGGAWVRKR